MNSTAAASAFPSWCVASVVRQDQIQAMALSNNVLLTMPIPDLSMPYNVITLVLLPSWQYIHAYMLLITFNLTLLESFIRYR